MLSGGDYLPMEMSSSIPLAPVSRGQTVADRQGRPWRLKWCSPGGIIGVQQGHVWWKHTLQIYLGAVVSERQWCHSQTLYLKLSFSSLFSAKVWYAEAEQILPLWFLTALQKFSTTLINDMIQTTLKSIKAKLPTTQYKYIISLTFLLAFMKAWPQYSVLNSHNYHYNVISLIHNLPLNISLKT